MVYLGRFTLVLVLKSQVECTNSHVWGSLAAGDVAAFVKHVVCQRSFWVMTMIEQSIKNEIELYFQNTKQMNVGSHCQHILIL